MREIMRRRGNLGRHKERKRASHMRKMETNREEKPKEEMERKCVPDLSRSRPPRNTSRNPRRTGTVFEPASWEKVQWYLESAARLQGEEMIGLRDKLMRGGACVARCLEKWFCIHEMVANTIWTCYHNGCQSDSACGSVAVLTEAINLKTIQKQN